MRKRYILVTALILLPLAGGIKGAISYLDYRSEKARFEKQPYFTKYKLDISEMGILRLRFYVDVTPSWLSDFSEEDWPD